VCIRRRPHFYSGSSNKVGADARGSGIINVHCFCLKATSILVFWNVTKNDSIFPFKSY
jgi:hypothetical protein